MRHLVLFLLLKNTKNLRPATLLKVRHLHGYLSRFLNCTNGIKLRKASLLVATLDDSPQTSILKTFNFSQGFH